MSRRPTRCGGGFSGGSTAIPRDMDEHISSHRRGSIGRDPLVPPDELDRALDHVIHSRGGDGNNATSESTRPPGNLGSNVSSSSSTNTKGVYKELGLEKANRAYGDRLPVDIRPETGRPSVREQAVALASEMGLACRECLPLSGDWHNVHEDLKKLAFERMNARLKLINLKDLITYDAHLRHMGLIRKRWRWRVHQDYLSIGDDARPPHCTDQDWHDIKLYWNSLDELEERLNRPVGRIELFEMTKRKNVSTQERPDGWLPRTRATHDKFIQMQNEVLASENPLNDDDIVDTVMNASNRSDCRPGAGYGPKAVGRSSKRSRSKQQYRDELMASNRKNEELSQTVKMLVESHAKLHE